MLSCPVWETRTLARGATRGATKTTRKAAPAIAASRQGGGMQTDRHYAFDNLRTIVVFLVVVLHGSMCYMAYAPQWWYVVDRQSSVLYTVLVLIIDVPIMLVMFFLAGYFAYPSVVRRGAARFFRDKLLRIGLPWVFGVLVLAPPTAYMIYFSRRSPLSLVEFWRTDFWGKAFQQSVYWYLGILLLLFAATALAYATRRRFAALQTRPGVPGAGLFAGFVLGMSAASLFVALGTGYTLDTWSHIYVLSYQPVRVPLYVGYFALGVHAGRRAWFTASGHAPARVPWTVLALVSGGAYLACRFGAAAALPASASAALSVVLFNVFCFSSLLAAIALFCAHLDCSNAFWRSQARNSYGIYYLHPLILYPLALAFVDVPLPIQLKAVTVIALGYLASWALSAFLLTRLPGLRRVF